MNDENIEKKEKLRKSYKKYYNSEKGKTRAKRYWLTNKQKILERRRELYKNLPKEELEKIKKRNENTRLKSCYGITLEDYNNLLSKQKLKCAICGKNVLSNSKKFLKFNIDHDHNTGKIRGLLCTNCNRALGFFKDDIELLDKAIQYLQQNETIYRPKDS